MTTLRHFADEEMDVSALCKCSREDVVELGLDKKGQQLKVTEEIAKHLEEHCRCLEPAQRLRRQE